MGEVQNDQDQNDGVQMDEDRNAELPGGHERRAKPRLRVDLTAAIYPIERGGKQNGTVKDLSLLGCRVLTDAALDVELHAHVEAGFYYMGLPFRVGGVIQGIYGPQEAGILFVDVTERIREKLQWLVEEIEKDKETGSKG
ncbi:MAG: PilZ domain-containing protein [Terracidiphilus sp.]|nr:PilZ domain-containing protein [Terracidiphilus sp.]